MKIDKHGANLFEIAKELNIDKSEIKDFSSNVNPLGISPLAKKYLAEHPEIISTYPDPHYRELKASIASYAKTDVDKIILGLGATELIKDYIEIIAPKNALILNPAYSEYENNLKSAGANIFKYNLKKEEDFKFNVGITLELIKDNNIDLFTFPNPNNPTGTALKIEELRKILDTGINVLVDECYVEFENNSVIPLTDEYKNLFVVRGTSKFFASPGLRLGYGILSDKNVLTKMEDRSYLWSINIVASELGNIMLRDEEYIKKTRDFIKREKEYFYNEMAEISTLKTYPSDANFILVEIKDGFTAADLRSYLMKSALIIRDCESFGLGKNFFRFCILDEESNRKLIKKIKEYIKKDRA